MRLGLEDASAKRTKAQKYLRQKEWHQGYEIWRENKTQTYQRLGNEGLGVEKPTEVVGVRSEKISIQS